MNSVVVTVIAVVAGLAAVAGLVALVLWFLRRSSRRIRAELVAEYPTAVLGPALGMYRGGTGDYSRVRSTCWLVLTTDALVVRPLIGATINVPVGEVTGTRVQKAFNTHTNGRPVLVLETARGEVGLTVDDLSTWQSALIR